MTSRALTNRPEIEAGLIAARAMRRQLGLRDEQPLACVLEIAERDLGLDVVIVPLADGVSGFYLPTAPRPLVVIAGDHPVARQRFTLAHELGHHVLGHGAAPRVHAAPPAAAELGPTAPQPELAAADVVLAAAEVAVGPAPGSHYAVQRQSDPNERAANAFAGELLTPDAGARAVLAGGAGEPPLDQAVRLSAHFGVSAFSALVKLQLLGVVDRDGFAAIKAQLREQAHLPRYDALGLLPLDDALQRHADSGAPVRCAPAARVLIARLRAEADAAIPA